MRQVVPYKTARGLERALDNGGRWFNVFTRAGDGKVTADELGKAAGAWDDETSQLFLALAWVLLEEEERAHILDALLESSFAERMRFFGPVWLRAHQVAEMEPRFGVILEGTFLRVRDRRIETTVLVPMMVNNALLPMPVQISNMFSMWEFHDRRGPPAIVLAKPHEQFTEGYPLRLAGLAAKTEDKQPLRYLRPMFYTALDGRERGRKEARPEDEWLREALRHVVR